MKLSVVIICKNWSPYLFHTLESVKGLGNELLLYDTGNLDNLKEKINGFDATIISAKWQNYGETRKSAYLLAKNDWILAIDTDEIVDNTLRQSIQQIDLSQEQTVYKLRFKNFIEEKEIKHGEWGNRTHIRLANRKAVTLESMIVHEQVVLKPGVKVKTLQGYVLHYTAKNIGQYSAKMLLYAKLSSEKYRQAGRKASVLNLFLSPAFNFLKNYVFKLGFLDGWQGFLCAGMSSWYTFLKYAYLRENNKKRMHATTTTASRNIKLKKVEEQPGH